ncbi:MAG: Uma2 family endonuclease [Chloroflexota bacterium]
MQSPLQAVAPWFEAQTEKDVVYDFFREEFWPDEAYSVFANNFNRQIELSNGKVVILPMPTLLHQRLSKRLFKMLDLWLAEHKLGEALYAPHPIRLWPGKYREPDVMAWLDEHRDRMGEQESAPPDLAVEIVSPGNEPHDTDTKFKEYALAGISEYWIVNPKTARISVYAIEGRDYKLVGDFGSGERARSNILTGFEVAVDDLFRAE